MYLSIDPGISTGYAYWSPGGVLTACGAGPDVPDLALSAVKVLVIEVPKVYSARLSKGDPNNLITLALQAGGYMYRFRSQGAVVRAVYPNEWKGQIPKDIHHPRIYARLATVEQAAVDKACRGLGQKAMGDMMDAIGLGIYARDMRYFK